MRSVDGTDNIPEFIGKEGRDFEFEHIAQKIEFLECSAKENTLGDVLEWINMTLC